MLDAVDSSRGDGWLAIGFGDTEVESGEALVAPRHIDARLQSGVVYGETLYYFHGEVNC